MGERPSAAAAFRFALDDEGARPRLLEQLVALRCTALRLPYGDQGLLIPKRLYDEVGGYRPLAVDGGRRSGAPSGASTHGHAAHTRGHERRALPPRGLRPPLRPQPALPHALHPARACPRDQPRLRLSPVCRVAASNLRDDGWRVCANRLRISGRFRRMAGSLGEETYAQHFTSWFRDFGGNGAAATSASMGRWSSWPGVRAKARSEPQKASSSSRSATSRSSRCTTASGRRRTIPVSSRTRRWTRSRPRSRPAAKPTRIVPIPFTVTAVRVKGKLVLFDSGTGASVGAHGRSHHQEQ